MQRSPFETLYGHVPRHFGTPDPATTTSAELEAFLRERESTMPLLQQQLLRAQARMVRQADKHRIERSFEEGELVYLKLQPYIQTSVARRSTQKLAFKFFGPYKILRRVGAVAYKLALPPGSRIHDVVHVSQLKRHLPPHQQVSDINTILLLDADAGLQPVEILATRSIQRGGVAVSQVRVAWTADKVPLVTWEDAAALRQAFPMALAWGQASSQGEGHVTARPRPNSHRGKPQKKREPEEGVEI